MAKKKEITLFKSENKGIGVCDVLTLIFVTLKLTGNIYWSWWWVLAPAWIPAVAIIGVVMVAFIIFSLFNIVDAILKKKEK
ncbi:MAG: hypothetical protein IIC75_00425 [Bacteroidetes bacterium]|nr:hypothetical protein [Bacteroidota bacterium]